MGKTKKQTAPATRAAFVEAEAVQVKPPIAAKAKTVKKAGQPTRPETVDRPSDRRVTGNRFTVDLQERHANWLRHVAAKEGRSPENMLDRIVRLAWQQDPARGEVMGENNFSGRRADVGKTEQSPGASDDA